MRLFYILLFLLPIIANELVFDIIQYQDYTISLLDSPVENQTEKESHDGNEKESKIDYITNNYISNNTISNANGAFSIAFSSNIITPFLEIHSPPPEVS